MNSHVLSEPPVLAALIAAFSALTIAIFQFFSQRRQSNSIEALKAKLAHQNTAQSKYLETYLNLLLEGRQQQTQACASLLQSIQIIRDKVRQFLEDPGSYDPEVMCSEMSEQADELIERYSANQLQLSDVARSVAHDTKNIAREMAVLFRKLRVPAPNKGEKTVYLNKIKSLGELLATSQKELRQHAIDANSAFVRSLEAENK